MVTQSKYVIIWWQCLKILQIFILGCAGQIEVQKCPSLTKFLPNYNFCSCLFVCLSVALSQTRQLVGQQVQSWDQRAQSLCLFRLFLDWVVKLNAAVLGICVRVYFHFVFCVYLDCTCLGLQNKGFLVGSSTTITFIKCHFFPATRISLELVSQNPIIVRFHQAGTNCGRLAGGLRGPSEFLRTERSTRVF